MTILILIIIFITGCSVTGSLSDKEYEAITDTLIKEKIVDTISNENTIGAGESEY